MSLKLLVLPRRMLYFILSERANRPWIDKLVPPGLSRDFEFIVSTWDAFLVGVKICRLLPCESSHMCKGQKPSQAISTVHALKGFDPVRDICGAYWGFHFGMGSMKIERSIRTTPDIKLDPNFLLPTPLSMADNLNPLVGIYLYWCKLWDMWLQGVPLHYKVGSGW